MRAPVYRNIDTPNALLGLTFPFEVTFVLAIFYVTVRISIATCVLATLATYVAVRVLNYGRAPGFLQHSVAWRVRPSPTGGLPTAGARAARPPLPFPPHPHPDGPTGGRWG